MLRVLLASPFPAMRAGLRALLEASARDPVDVVGEADTVETCLDLAASTQPQIIVFDLALDTGEEIDGLWRLRAQAPSVPVLALSEAYADPRVLAALQAALGPGTVGQPVTVKVVRGGEVKAVKVVIGER